MIHASGESSTGDLPEGTHAYALSVDSERELLEVAARLRRACVPHVLITEPDPPWSGAAMAIGVRPGRKEDLRRHLSSLRLLE